MGLLSKFAKGVDWLSGGLAKRGVIIFKIKEYGKVIKLEIDNKKQSVVVAVELKGEASPIELRIDKYEICKENGKTFLQVNQASCKNKPWMNALLKNFASGQRIEVPTDKVDFLNEFLA